MSLMYDSTLEIYLLDNSKKLERAKIVIEIILIYIGYPSLTLNA